MSNVKKYLIWSIGGVVISYGLVIFNALGWLPINLPIFILLTLIVLGGCLYRPAEMFWIFIVTLSLENIVISPEQVPFTLSPFQFLGGVLFVAVIILWVSNKLKAKFPILGKYCLVCKLNKEAVCGKVVSGSAFNFFDRIIFILPIFAFLAVINAPDKSLSLKLAAILVTFVILYWLGRNFLQTQKARCEALWFFVVGSEAVVLFGLYQAVAKKVGWPAFQVMDGRINSTFAEPDWFGVYLTFLLAVIFWLRLAFRNFRNNIKIASWNFNRVVQITLSVYFFFIFLCLFLTVSRSAWLGFVGVVTAYYLIQILSSKFPIKNYQFRYRWILAGAGTTILIVALAVFTASALDLSTFHFGNRAVSPFSGKQKITVSCLRGSNVPSEIVSTNELAEYNCKHINLEDIEKEKVMGFEVREVYRPDPNVDIRKNIYRVSLAEIIKHPLVGQGLGSSSVILGRDERGAGLNTSNIFLESWFSMGVVGLAIVLLVFVYPIFFSCKRIFLGEGSLLELFVIMTMFGFLIPNLFNSGLMLGFFWVWISAMSIFWQTERELE